MNKVVNIDVDDRTSSAKFAGCSSELANVLINVHVTAPFGFHCSICSHRSGLVSVGIRIQETATILRHCAPSFVFWYLCCLFS